MTAREPEDRGTAREPAVDRRLALEHGLTGAEWERIREILGRTPTFPELGIFSVMWSEHCSYKSSKKYLKRLPTEGPRVIHGPGENAGVVDIGGGLAAVFKIESHNHPSFVEPRQGAATGVGGILRDIFTMGARPVASLDSIRFGPLDDPRHRYLLQGVVDGIGGYGNPVGVPTVGGETWFHECYRGNILVNAFNVGVVEADRVWCARAAGVGNPVIYVGSKTGRDGIHGASLLASAEFDEESEAKRPTVQVGDPFTEKCLIEACLELMATDALVGIQDMGAAGLTCSSFEMASHAGTGIELDLDRVPRRESGMTPYELLLSESQERMLLVAAAGREDEVFEIFRRWDLDAAVVGRVTEGGRLVARWRGRTVVDIPVDPVAKSSPELDRPAAEPAALRERQKLDPAALAPEDDPTAALEALLDSPNLGSKEWVWRQYDQLVQGNTVVGPGGDAAVVRVRRSDGTPTPRGLALAVDCNPRWCWLDPYAGALAAVAEATRNVACTGARPLALTNCLNFGNPEKPEIMWEFAEATRGMADAARALGTPIVSGNVSFYNETSGRAIYPTPVIAAVGLLDDWARHAASHFPEPGLAVVLLGETREELGGSAWLALRRGREEGPPPAVDLAREARLQALLRRAVAAGVVRSAHDVSEGGLAVTLAECALAGPEPVGAVVSVGDTLRPEALLFGESTGRVVASTADPDALLALAGDGMRIPVLTAAEEARLLAERERDHFHDECGVFGIHGHPEASKITYLGLYALQHRGQESCGIVSSTSREHFVHRAMGLVADVMNEAVLARLPGRNAIGHVRYSTAGESQLRNAQPFCATTDAGPVAIAHNGNLVNAAAIRRELEGRGAIFSTTSDSEVIVQLLARSREHTVEERLIDALSRLKGAYSLVMLTPEGIVAARDPYGFRPLSLGRLDGAWVAASETCALDLIGASFERDLDPGEVVVIRRGRLRTLRPFAQTAPERFCIFEYIYFARPDSNLNGHNVYTFRKELGRALAREHPVAADVVVPVLDSGNTAALGYAEESGIPYEQAMIRNHYVRRTFIEPAQSIRHFGVKVKHNAVQGVLQGRRVVLVDDSIVRGTTLTKLVTMLRGAGAREVHLRISSPPTIGPCHYGIDTPTREELVASTHTVEEICRALGADSLGYLSLEALRRTAERLKHGFCDACFSDEYPVPVDASAAPPQLSLFREVEPEGD